MYKTIYFDFDGVLTIDAKGSLSLANFIVAKTGLDKDLFLEKYREFGQDLLTGKKNHVDIWPALSAELDYKLEEKLIEDSFTATPINYEVVDLVKELKNKGYQIGLITDNKADRMKTLLAYHQWQELFDVLAISAHVGSRKSQPEIYHYALEAGKTAATEAVFIDNTLKNLDIPRSLGYETIFFDNDKRDVAALRRNLIDLGIKL